jgi:hypothetical protein
MSVADHCTQAKPGSLLLMGKYLSYRSETSWCDAVAETCPEFWPTVDADSSTG